MWVKPSVARVVGLDLARCLALVGMMVAHILPHTSGGAVPWQQRVVTGNAAALFAVLAGVTCALLSGRSVPHRGRRRIETSMGLAVRAVIILAIGIGLDDLHDPGIGVILPYYGVLFVLGLPFLGLRARTLFEIAAGWAVAVPVLSMLIRSRMADDPSVGFSGLSPVQIGERLLFTGDYPAFPWLAYLLCGMAIGRLALERVRVAAWICSGGAAVFAVSQGVSILLLRARHVHSALVATAPDGPARSWALLQVQIEAGMGGTTPTSSWWWLTVAAPHSATALDLASSSGAAMVAIGASLLVARRWSRVWQVVAGAGAMTLTLYSAHLVMLLPQTWPDFGPPRLLSELVVVIVAGSAFAILHLRGPLEGAVTWVSRAVARWMMRALRLTPHSDRPPPRAASAPDLPVGRS